MNKILSHLPKQKQRELKHIAKVISRACNGVEMIVLFGSYARGDWKDGPHEQGRGRLTIHKKSDYDILVITKYEYIARDICLWDKIKEECTIQNISTYVRIIARDIEFVNYKLHQGQYFFTEIIKDGISLYDNGNSQLDDKKELDPAEEKRIAQDCLDEIFSMAEEFFDTFSDDLRKNRYKKAAFELHQACEHALKAVLLIFGDDCPQEHHLDILGNLAEDYCLELIDTLPRKTQKQKELFELLDYAYIGARYDRSYKITKEQLEQLVPYVKKLHEIIERNCKEKINSFTEEG